MMHQELKRIGRWAAARARERSTYTGLALLLSVAGLKGAGATVEQIGTAVALIAGGGLVATSRREEE